ncbi:DUF3093 domain-containing protein [Nocardioides sp. TF02-7]|uniref:DUF3093 domain-containing protein n=1 Tax=Nocardioides sp. TF02-7 TaxID=2917724 RepID=UPI001F070EBB|nr:DUF3093 domain-containing protein [Nocardioides sp. TF02-7]UMG92255.1 DUF3093 domain-containing protein [Nocardioides sp. TF02-7]
MRASTSAYSERLHVPVRWWLTWLTFVATFWVAMVVALPPAWTWGFTAGLVAIVVAALSAYGTARIRVADGLLEAGRARIELPYLGAVEVLDRARMRDVAGPEADARAFLLLRPYVRGGVRVMLADPADPTPYWLLSSRNPQRLASALSSAMSTTVEVGRS